MKPLVPAYHWYGETAWWTELLLSPPSVLIINPGSGPGDARDPNWQRTIELAHQHGHQCLGYVPLGYGDRSWKGVLTDLGCWEAWYSLDGWFLDECPADFGAASALTYLGRLLWPKIVVANPGQPPTPVVAAALPGAVFVTHEGTAMPPSRSIGIPATRQAWLRRGAPDKATAAADMARMAKVGRTGLGYGYSTTDREWHAQ